eukprot:gene2086-4076_t
MSSLNLFSLCVLLTLFSAFCLKDGPSLSAFQSRLHKQSEKRENRMKLLASADKDSSTLNALDLCICGAIASVVGDFIMHPVDTIKITQQASTVGISVMEASKRIMAQGGPAAFYQGVVPYLVADGISGSIKFAAFEISKRFVEKRVPEKYHAYTKFLCAAGAYVACSVALVPGEVLKTGLQAGAGSSLMGLVKKTWMDEGMKGFFVGYGATLLRDVPYTMLELGLYDNIKTFIRKFQKREDLTQGEELTSAAITGGFTSFVTTPLDVIKTKLMTQTLAGAVQYGGIGDVFNSIMTKDGTSGLFSGSLARVVWLLPFTTIYLGVYEVAKRRLALYKQNKDRGF